MLYAGLDRRLLRRIRGYMRLWLLLLIGLAGCITPSIPIPPPDPAEMQFHLTTSGMASTAVFTYPAHDAYKGASAYVLDQRTNQGVFQLANDDGSIGPTLPLPATLGDQVVVSIQNTEQTVSACVVLKEGAQDPNVYCQ
jgi:hypothetical protein